MGLKGIYWWKVKIASSYSNGKKQTHKPFSEKKDTTEDLNGGMMVDKKHLFEKGRTFSGHTEYML